MSVLDAVVHPHPFGIQSAVSSLALSWTVLFPGTRRCSKHVARRRHAETIENTVRVVEVGDDLVCFEDLAVRSSSGAKRVEVSLVIFAGASVSFRA